MLDIYADSNIENMKLTSKKYYFYKARIEEISKTMLKINL